MSLIRALVTIPSGSALPADAVTNTFLFGTASTPATETELGLIIDALHDFYTGVHPPAVAISDFMSSLLDPSTATVRFYDLSDPTPRVPIGGARSLGWTEGTGNDALPREVALCLSAQAVSVSGVNQARRRSRVYIGPLSRGALDEDTGRPAAGFIDAVGYAGEQLRADSAAAAEWSWVVISGLDSTEAPPTAVIDNGWVDNEFDTQRRRGLRPTTRFLIPT